MLMFCDSFRLFFFFFSSRRRHTRCLSDWSSDVCSSDLTSCAAAVAQSDLGLISVGTPGRPNGQLDVAAIGAVAREIGVALTARAMPFPVVLRSTVLPGTT